MSTSVLKASTQEINKYLCFLLQGGSYGVSILEVKEIIEHTEVTPLPMMPDFFAGTLNLRGRVVPVVDLAMRLNMGKAERSRRGCIVILEININGESVDVGAMVDAVSQVADIAPENIEPAPTFAGNLNTAFIRGMGKIGADMVVLLHVGKVLSLEDVAMLSQAAETPAELPPVVTGE